MKLIKTYKENAKSFSMKKVKESQIYLVHQQHINNNKIMIASQVFQIY